MDLGQRVSEYAVTMKVIFPRIVREFLLSEYAPEVSGRVQVWVNPPKIKMVELFGTFKTYLGERTEQNFLAYLEVVSELLSQGEEKYSVDELKELHDNTQETDPAFWMWMQERVLKEILEHQSGQKKI